MKIVLNVSLPAKTIKDCVFAYYHVVETYVDKLCFDSMVNRK